MLETMDDLVQCSKADDFDAHLVCPEDGKLDLAIDALLRRRDEILQLVDSDNKERRNQFPGNQSDSNSISLEWWWW
jgi:hypothetical protein